MKTMCHPVITTMALWQLMRFGLFSLTLVSCLSRSSFDLSYANELSVNFYILMPNTDESVRLMQGNEVLILSFISSFLNWLQIHLKQVYSYGQFCWVQFSFLYNCWFRRYTKFSNLVKNMVTVKILVQVFTNI